jgi:cardiolipin synthase
MDVLDVLARFWHYLVLALSLALSAGAAGHALLYKRDSRAATLWVGFAMLVPLIGAATYFLLGINRIRRRAASLRGDLERFRAEPTAPILPPESLEEYVPESARHLVDLAHLVDRVVVRPLLPGNRVDPLVNGDEAYPAMLGAIESASQSIALATYIFDNDRVGRRFVAALRDAAKRGVEVRVLIDDTGARYSFPSIVRTLRRAGVRVERFLPTFTPLRLMFANLRNHRKILVTDGRVAFTGGMNLREGHELRWKPKYAVQDLQFRVEGPVVAQLQEVFANDWSFTCGEALRGEKWFPSIDSTGPVVARGITDGPDEDFEKLRWTILGALSCAKSTVVVMTPYFLPDQSIISALNVAAMRGVDVDILLPSKSNLPAVQWAMSAQLWQVLERGCRVWLTPPPFDHSKVFLVDNCWSLVGSTNWDPRSLRLNFEFNLECYEANLAGALEELVRSKLKHARRLTLEEVDGRSLPIRLRDGVARLLTPFL